MRGIARLNDKTLGDCAVHGPNIRGRIISGSGDVSVNGRSTARLGDKVLADCGHISDIITSGVTEDTNNKGGTARLNDKVGNSPYTARIITASTNTFGSP